jgi:hypothetical protein
VSDETCPVCGFAPRTVSPADALVAVRSFPRRYREALADVEEPAAHARPASGGWSAVEYIAHVADRLDTFAEWVRRIRTERNVHVDAVWDPDERAVEHRYNDRPVAQAVADLDGAARRLVSAAEPITASEWTTEATLPSGPSDLLGVVRGAAHEGSHHLRDVEHLLASTLA